MMRHRSFSFSLFIVYMAVMSILLVWEGKWIAPDVFLLALLFISLFIRKTRRFLIDWLPFLLILISYDYLRGFADNLNLRVHYTEAINIDKALFGFVPTVKLQALFFNPTHLHWYDFLATALYLVHFALPLGFAFFLWSDYHRKFKQFITGFLLLSYAALFTYLLFPAAPPWLASDKGLIGPVQKVLFSTTSLLPNGVHFPTLYDSFNPNPVAAIPSLHAAYPFIVFLFAYQYFRKKALFLFPYVLGVWIALVYLGEHYVFDIILGGVYAAASFLVATKVLHHTTRQENLTKWVSSLTAIPQKLLNFNWKNSNPS